MARTVQCIKLGREAEGLDFPMLPGELGKRVFENVSKEAWAGWIKLQTMIINENRLNLADAQHRKYLMEQAEKYFFGEGVGIAVRKEDAGLRRAMDWAMARIAQRGAYGELYRKYFPVGFY